MLLLSSVLNVANYSKFVESEYNSINTFLNSEIELRKTLLLFMQKTANAVNEITNAVDIKVVHQVLSDLKANIDDLNNNIDNLNKLLDILSTLKKSNYDIIAFDENAYNSKYEKTIAEYTNVCTNVQIFIKNINSYIIIKFPNETLNNMESATNSENYGYNILNNESDNDKNKLSYTSINENIDKNQNISSNSNVYANKNINLNSIITKNQTIVPNLITDENQNIESNLKIDESQNIKVNGNNSSTINTNSFYNSNIPPENTLIISETKGKVYLPYTKELINNILANNHKNYSSISEVIKKDFTIPLTYYKNSSISRFKEAFKLVKKVEKGSIKQAFDLGMELLFKYNLHPAIISACRNLDELDIYLDCLESNETNKFRCFNIAFEIAPTISKKKL